MDSKMIEFAKWVLYTMTNDEDWTCGTLDGIATEAARLQLAKLDEDGMFVGQTPEAIECRRLQLEEMEMADV